MPRQPFQWKLRKSKIQDRLYIKHHLTFWEGNTPSYLAFTGVVMVHDLNAISVKPLSTVKEQRRFAKKIKSSRLVSWSRKMVRQALICFVWQRNIKLDGSASFSWCNAASLCRKLSPRSSNWRLMSLVIRSIATGRMRNADDKKSSSHQDSRLHAV